MLLVYTKKDKEIHVSSPSYKVVESLLRDLYGIILETNFGILAVTGQDSGRFWVWFDNSEFVQDYEDEQGGNLMDSNNLMMITPVKFILDNGQAEYIPFNETVPINKALEVIEHVIEKNNLPKGLKWSGDMSNYN